MKKEYDFSKGKRGAIEPISPNKRRITIRLDNEIIEWFRYQVEVRGGGNYQTLINNALHEYIRNRGETLENIIRKVLREEIQNIRPLKLMKLKIVSPNTKTATNNGIRDDIRNLNFGNNFAITPRTITHELTH